MMLTLALLACLSSDPATCSKAVVVRQDEVAAGTTCDSLAAEHIPLWSAAHPDQSVQRYWCTSSRIRTGEKTASAKPCPSLTAQTARLKVRQNSGRSAFADCKG